MAVITTTCGTCGGVKTREGDGFTEVYVWKCVECLADEAKADDLVFEATLSAEAAVKGEMAVLAMGDLDTRARAKVNLKTARARLAELIDGMSLDQLQAYGEFRKARRAAMAD